MNNAIWQKYTISVHLTLTHVDKTIPGRSYLTITDNTMDQCMFCLKSCSQSPSPPDGGIVGASNCKSLESQLLQHFILRKLLDIPWMWCEDSLRRQSTGEVQKLLICRKCSLIVHQAWSTHQKLVSLEVKFKQVKEGIKKSMLESIQKLRKTSSASWENEIRMLIFPNEMTAQRKPKFSKESEDYLKEILTYPSSPEENVTRSTDDVDWNECDPLEDVLGESWPANKDLNNIKQKRKRKSRQKESQAKRKYAKGEGFVKEDFKCDICPAKFADREALQHHLDFHRESKERGLECETCSFPARSIEELEVHRFHDHDNKLNKFTRPFVCGVGECDFKAEIWRVVRDHADEKHPDISPDELGSDLQLKCAPCSKFYDTANTLINHQKKMHPELFGAPLEPIKCDQCSILLPSRIHLQYHLRSVHKRLNMYICDLCGKGFCQQRRLDRHKIVHEDRHDFVCHLCGCSYSYQSSLSGHYKKFHSDFEESATTSSGETLGGASEEFCCKYCDLKFPFKISMIRHMKSHKETMGVQCEVCSKYYVNIQGLKQHMKLNHSTSDQQTQCPHCFKVFSNPHAMHTHSVKHCKIKKMNEGIIDPVSIPPSNQTQSKQDEFLELLTT